MKPGLVESPRCRTYFSTYEGFLHEMLLHTNSNYYGTFFKICMLSRVSYTAGKLLVPIMNLLVALTIFDIESQPTTELVYATKRGSLM